MALNDTTLAFANPTSAALAHDYAECYAIMQAASKNYSSAARLLPRDKAVHVTALYAVLRVGDDLVDVNHGEYASPQAAIESWQEMYYRAFHTGDSPHPVLRAYLHTAQEFCIAPDILQTYFRAMSADLTTTRFPTFDHLMRYIEGSAIPVGRAMTHILGTTTRHYNEAYPAADALSIAMQLSNFWRDIGEDWERGRVYIPQEDLQRFDYSESDLAARCIDERFINLLEFEFARTEDYYRQARDGVRLLASGQLGVMSSLYFYHAILPSIRRNRYDVFSKRAGSSRLRKYGLMAQAWWQTRQNAIWLEQP
jgi:phytoene synthase